MAAEGRRWLLILFTVVTSAICRDPLGVSQLKEARLPPLIPVQNKQQQPQQPAVQTQDSLVTQAQPNNTHGGHVLEPMSVKVLMAEDGGVRVESVATPDVTSLLNHSTLTVYSLDYHYRRGLIFYTAFNAILRQEVVGRLVHAGLPKAVVTVGVEGSLSLAVDWLHDRLYWLSHRHHTVESAALDGTDRTTLVDTLTDTAFPNNLAVDPYSGYIFIAGNGSVYRYNLTGRQLVRLPPRGVRCLTLNLEEQKMIYSGKRGDYSTGKVFLAACDYQGENCDDLPLSGRWNDIFSLDYFRNTLYFAHYSGVGRPDSLWSADISRTPFEPTFRRSSKGLYSVRVYHGDEHDLQNNATL